jgi:hypothetical protein
MNLWETNSTHAMSWAVEYGWAINEALDELSFHFYVFHFSNIVILTVQKNTTYTKCIFEPCPVVHICNHSYFWGRYQEDCGLSPAWEYSLQKPISEITIAKWTGGMTQAAEHLLCKWKVLSSNSGLIKKVSLLLCTFASAFTSRRF